MILALLLAAAAPQTAVDAEREFAARAQTEGMWTAFRATAADDAILFVPKPVNAQAWMVDRKDPQIGYMWWPAHSFVSCDGTIAVNTGPSVLSASRGYFTTIWRRQPDGGWKWVFDHGDTLSAPRAAYEVSKVRKASCRGRPAIPPVSAQSILQGNGSGASPDGTLTWSWTLFPNAGRQLNVHLWDGSALRPVLEDKVVPAP